jgi:deazaflavin-dependent oxidoreductase (nitroreductase family)
MLNDFTQQIIKEFRANAGQVGGPFDGARLLLLTTTGARSGASHTTILGYYPDTAGRVLVVGSAGGGPKHPDWYYNLLANPGVTVETGLFTYEATALVLRDAERDEIFTRLAEADPGWAEYQAKSSRTIPVIALTPVTIGPPSARLLRRDPQTDPQRLPPRTRLDPQGVASSGPSLGAQLRINCLTLCQGLHFHHTGETAGLFPSLLVRHPDLAPTITRLQSEHDQIANLLDDLQHLVSTSNPSGSLPKLDELIDGLNAHLDHEEAQLLPLL